MGVLSHSLFIRLIPPTAVVEPACLNTMDLNEVKLRLDEQGYAILEDLLAPREAERLDATARPIMEVPRDNIWGANGYVSMEGSLNHIPDLAPLCIHPTILELLGMVLGENYFLANNVAMKWCKPGTHVGGLHSAGGSKPAQTFTGYPTDLQVFWMLTDFTYENGATMIVPFSHHTRRSPTRAAYPQEIPVLGKKGSVCVFYDSLWHRSGANTTTDQHRMSANVFYLPWFIHRSDGQWPRVKRELYAQFPPRLQELLVRSVENPT